MNSKAIKSLKKYNIIKNNFTIYQIKKMIGKKIILISPLITADSNHKNLSKIIKSKILENISDIKLGVKNLIITTVCSNGILYVIKNIEVFLAINSISYKELDTYKNNNDINILVLQYPQMPKSEIKEIIQN